MPPAFVGAFCIPICLFWFGWTSRPAVHWVVPIIGSSFFTIGALLMFNAVLVCERFPSSVIWAWGALSNILLCPQIYQVVRLANLNWFIQNYLGKLILSNDTSTDFS